MQFRSTKYSRKTLEAICLRLAEGESLRKICACDDMPSRHTVQRWLLTYPEFEAAYRVARQMQADHFVDEIVDIADTESNAALAKVRIDARKWMAAILKPKSYGALAQSGDQNSGDMLIERLNIALDRVKKNVRNR